MKLNETQKIAIWAGIAVAVVAAVAWWIIRSRRKNGGLLVIGNVSATVANNNNTTESIMNSNSNQGGNAQAQFGNTSLPLGYRNNNPLNILYGASLWKGKVIPNTDTSKPRKEQFVSMAYGYRAALYLIRKHIRGGYNTLARLVNRWGTGAQSDQVTSYVSFVSKKTGIAPGTTLSPDNMEQLCKIAWAMAWFENGKAPSSMDDIYQGWALL